MTARVSFLPILCMGVALLGIGLFLGRFSMNLTTPNSYTEVRAGGGTFTNPLLECDAGGATIASQKIDFTPDLTQFVNNLKHSKNISDISVYFRDLNNGPVVNINQKDTFIPASLLKVPTLIAYLKWSEDNPTVLDESFLFAVESSSIPQLFPPKEKLELGKTYSARELLERMIKYSDNQALILLYERLPKEYQMELFSLLGIDSRLLTQGQIGITASQYSSFFRILFNASFLSKANSEYALSLLSQTTFNEGLKEAVPARVKISHKFGERESDGGLKQFHDCGIVYYPKHPYLICVMTKGERVDDLISSIEDISNFVYKKIDSQYKGE